VQLLPDFGKDEPQRLRDTEENSPARLCVSVVKFGTLFWTRFLSNEPGPQRPEQCSMQKQTHEHP
jgi:hypothetical protein